MAVSPYFPTASGPIPPTGRPSALAIARNVAIFLAVLAGFEWGVDRIESPFEGADKIEKKFAYFAAHRDEFDFVFIGSSRVMNQISPRVFDRAMAAAGRPCRSINLGYAAMFLPESSFLVDRVLALRPAHLRGMLVELSSPPPRHDENHPLMAREVYWHGPVATSLACASILTDGSPGFSAAERWEQGWRQLSIEARCLLHLDTGSALVTALRSRGRDRPADRLSGKDTLGPDADGFFPLTTMLGEGRTGVFKTGGSAVDRGDYETSVAALRAGEAAGPAPSTPPPFAALGQAIVSGVLHRQASALRSFGIEPIYFIGPGTTREQPFLDLAARGAIPRLLAFNDPAAYPELYRSDMRADRYHLNPRGAELLTRLLAQRLIAPGAPVLGE